MPLKRKMRGPIVDDDQRGRRLFCHWATARPGLWTLRHGWSEESPPFCGNGLQPPSGLVWHLPRVKGLAWCSGLRPHPPALVSGPGFLGWSQVNHVRRLHLFANKQKYASPSNLCCANSLLLLWTSTWVPAVATAMVVVFFFFFCSFQGLGVPGGHITVFCLLQAALRSKSC